VISVVNKYKYITACSKVFLEVADKKLSASKETAMRQDNIENVFIQRTSQRNKQNLIAMMTNPDQKKPNWRTKLGKLFSNYINESSPTFDPEFTRKARLLRPDWFQRPTTYEKSPNKNSTIKE
jgi:hypothetical protein